MYSCAADLPQKGFTIGAVTLHRFFFEHRVPSANTLGSKDLQRHTFDSFIFRKEHATV
jgi:hypothetical protein